MQPRAADRAEREATFHDARFGHNDGTRYSTRFYALAGTSKAEFARRVARIEAPARVLELGCGPDSAAWELAGRGVEVEGIDISTTAIDLARTRRAEQGIEGVHFTAMNAERLEFGDASFDAVIGSSILHHLELDQAITEIRRVLRPGGRAIFYEPLGKNPAINLYRRLTPSERSEDERPLTLSDLDRLAAAFDQVDQAHFHLVSLASLALRRTRWFGSARQQLETLDRALFGRFPSLRPFAWVVVIDAHVDEA